MKVTRIFIALCFALLMAGSAFASDKSTVDLSVSRKVDVAGTTLQPGDYKVVLTRNGDNYQARFLSNGKEVMTKTGHFEQRDQFQGSVSAVYANGSQTLKEIDVKHLKGAVVFDNGASGSAAGNQ